VRRITTLTPYEFDLIDKHGWALFYYGEVYYVDQFSTREKPRELHWCLDYVPAKNAPQESLAFCPSKNTAR